MILEYVLTGFVTILNLAIYGLIIFLLWQLIVRRKSPKEIYHKFFK